MKAWMSSNFGKFATELLPLIDIRIEFLLNILKMNGMILWISKSFERRVIASIDKGIYSDTVTIYLKHENRYFGFTCVCFECKNKYYTYKLKCHLDVIMRFGKYICVVYSGKIKLFIPECLSLICGGNSKIIQDSRRTLLEIHEKQCNCFRL